MKTKEELEKIKKEYGKLYMANPTFIEQLNFIEKVYWEAGNDKTL